jgi:hypothetical protein
MVVIILIAPKHLNLLAIGRRGREVVKPVIERSRLPPFLATGSAVRMYLDPPGLVVAIL